MARDLPRGTVTFLFTDIEGSTRLLKRLGEAYGGALAEHQRILREAFARVGGEVIDTQGDSFFVAFTRAKDAVAAAIAGQDGLASHRWPRARPFGYAWGSTLASRSWAMIARRPGRAQRRPYRGRRARGPGPPLECHPGAHRGRPSGRCASGRPRRVEAEGHRSPGAAVPAKRSRGATPLSTSPSRRRENQWLSGGRNGVRLVYSAPGGALTAALYDGRVVQVGTTNPYSATANGISVGSLAPPHEGAEPGVDTWRGFVFEGHLSRCLRGEHAATQLIQRPFSTRVASIFITDDQFLAYLPALIDPNPFTGGEEFFCAPRPLEP
jgi:Adenylate and Guanylate cyclase catalytic domain